MKEFVEVEIVIVGAEGARSKRRIAKFAAAGIVVHVAAVLLHDRQWKNQKV